MKTTKEQMKLNFDSFDFHAEEMRKMETEMENMISRRDSMIQAYNLQKILLVDENKRIEKIRRFESVKIPQLFNYSSLVGLSNESKEKLACAC